MKCCPNCRYQAKDEDLFCPVCGTTLDALPTPGPEYFYREPQRTQIPALEPSAREVSSCDHTADFLPSDIADHKLLSMVAYLLDFVGVIIGLLMAPHSPFLRFHLRQSLKLTVLEALVLFASLLLCWTVLVPVLGLAAMIILLVLRLICFTNVCYGKAIDAPLLRSFRFLN